MAFMAFPCCALRLQLSIPSLRSSNHELDSVLHNSFYFSRVGAEVPVYARHSFRVRMPHVSVSTETNETTPTLSKRHHTLRMGFSRVCTLTRQELSCHIVKFVYLLTSPLDVHRVPDSSSGKGADSINLLS